MFKHILLPTDGSEISSAMIRKCIAFAAENRAMVTGLHVLPVHRPAAATTRDDDEQYRRDSEAHGRLCLSEIELIAQDHGVPCKTVLTRNDRPYEAILEAAREAGCDLICMATHGHGGYQRKQLGSETEMVLFNSRLPVLVLR